MISLEALTAFTKRVSQIRSLRVVVQVCQPLPLSVRLCRSWCLHDPGRGCGRTGCDLARGRLRMNTLLITYWKWI